MRTKLESIHIENWKSFREVDIDFGDINVLIGPNGSGKSNLVQFFHMINMMMTGSLQLHVARSGGASSLLHYGPKRSQEIICKMVFTADKGEDTYLFRLIHGSPDNLVFAQEHVSFKAFDHSGAPFERELGVGHIESRLAEKTSKEDQTLGFVRGILARCRYFQFHDTSAESFIRRPARIESDSYLLHNGGNVATVLWRLQAEYPNHYSKVVSRIKTAVPAFGRFAFEQGDGNLRLDWLDGRYNERFGPHQLSDGAIRLIALITLLSLPDQMAPSVLIVDEPELGLFPAAIEILVDAIREASERCQIVLATQSVRLVQYLNPVSVICCGWDSGVSRVTRLSPADEFEFMDGYSLGDYMER